MASTVEDKEILVEELEEHLSQVLESNRGLGNPFIDIPHPKLFDNMANYLHYLEHGHDSYDAYDEIRDDDIANNLDIMMREVLSCP
jgi:hypothetical protein